MNKQSKIPEPTLEAALRALGLENAELESSETRATDTRVWRISSQGRSLAVRVLRPSQREVMQSESATMRQALKHGIPVPEIVATGLVNGQNPAMALDWLDGETVGDTLLRNPRLVRRLGQSAGKLLARIHRIQCPDGYPTMEWIDKETAVDPELRKRLIEANPGRCSLIHLDYHPFNLMSNGGHVTGVLDWTNATYGDPRADIARTVSIMQLAAPALVARRGAKRLTLGLFTRAFLSGYRQEDGDLKDMAPFFAWAGRVIHRDLIPKIHAYPLSDPDRFVARIERWTETWLERARTTTMTD